MPSYKNDRLGTLGPIFPSRTYFALLLLAHWSMKKTHQQGKQLRTRTVFQGIKSLPADYLVIPPVASEEIFGAQTKL